VILAEVGSIICSTRHPTFISTDPAQSRYRPILSTRTPGRILQCRPNGCARMFKLGSLVSLTPSLQIVKGTFMKAGYGAGAEPGARQTQAIVLRVPTVSSIVRANWRLTVWSTHPSGIPALRNPSM
jgi:hypothetical protein